jgi:hypothetical protein
MILTSTSSLVNFYQIIIFIFVNVACAVIFTLHGWGVLHALGGSGRGADGFVDHASARIGRDAPR